jgi:hypothetical protein
MEIQKNSNEDALEKLREILIVLFSGGEIEKQDDRN